MSEELKNGRYIEEFGTVRWYLNGLLHREGGPAIVNLNGTESWWRHGVLHRDDGPAIYRNGKTSMQEWYQDGVKYTEEEHSKIMLNKKLTEQLEEKPSHKRIKI